MEDEKMSQASNNPQNTPKKEKKNKQDWKEQAKKLPLLRRLSHNTSLKVLSLVFAIIIWAVIMSQTNPPRKKIVYDVPIEITGLQSLTSRDLALKYTPEEMEGTVDVVLEVPLDDLSKVSIDNVTATVDLSRITSKGEYQVNLNLSSRYGSAITAPVNSFNIEVEALQDSKVPVKVNYTGTLDETLHQGHAVISPAEFSISGPETEVNRVSYAQVDVDLGSLSESFVQSLVFTLYDANDMPIEFDDFDISIGNSVSVSIPIYPIKEVSIAYEDSLSGAVQDGYVLSKVEAYPKTVRVAAEQSVLDSLATISTSAFSIDDLNEDTVLTVSLRQPTDVEWMELQEVDLTLSVDEVMETKTFAYVPVEVRNLADGFTVDTFDARVDVTITAPKSELDALTRDDICAYLDLASYGVGQSVEDVQLSIEKLSQYSASLTPDRITFEISAE